MIFGVIWNGVKRGIRRVLNCWNMRSTIWLTHVWNTNVPGKRCLVSENTAKVQISGVIALIPAVAVKRHGVGTV